jgi:hypothetical protein
MQIAVTAKRQAASPRALLFIVLALGAAILLAIATLTLTARPAALSGGGVAPAPESLVAHDRGEQGLGAIVAPAESMTAHDQSEREPGAGVFRSDCVGDPVDCAYGNVY